MTYNQTYREVENHDLHSLSAKLRCKSK
jgi:hypothetical protein